MKTKEQAIEEVYIKLLGEKMYNENKSIINFDDGTIKLKVGLKLPNNGVGFSFITPFSDFSLIIPNDLIDIKNNNGWLKIESEEDLPEEALEKELVFWLCIHDTPFMGFFYMAYEGLSYSCVNFESLPEKVKGYHIGSVKKLQGFQPIEIPKQPPIYF